MKIPLVFLTLLLYLFHFPLAATETYQFKQFWPLLSQPWYFTQPLDIVEDQQGNFYVTDSDNILIRKLTSTGHLIDSWKWHENKKIVPRKLAVDSEGSIFVLYRFTQSEADYDPYTEERPPEFGIIDGIVVQKFTPAGQHVKEWQLEKKQTVANIQTNGLDGADSLVIDREDNLYVAANNLAQQRSLSKFDPNGKLIQRWLISEVCQDSESEKEEASHFNTLHLALDDYGNFYISEENKHCIGKYDAQGKLLTQWGKFGSEPGQLKFPADIEVIGDYLYVADRGNSRLQKFTLDGKLVDEWGDAQGISLEIILKKMRDPKAWFNSVLVQFIQKQIAATPVVPSEMKVTGNEILKIFANHERSINVEDGLTAILSLINDFKERNVKFSVPSGLGKDSKGNLYVTYLFPESAIQHYFPNGQPGSRWSNQQSQNKKIAAPLGIAVSPRTNAIYVADALRHRVMKFKPDWELDLEWQNSTCGQAQFLLPISVTVDSQGRVYVADALNLQIYRLDEECQQEMVSWHNFGDVLNSLSSPSSLFTSPSLLLGGGGLISAVNELLNNLIVPINITADRNDQIYVVDGLGKRIYHYDSNGNLQNQFGGREELNAPFGIAVTDQAVYVTDTYIHLNSEEKLVGPHIVKFDLTGKLIEKYGQYKKLNPGDCLDSYDPKEECNTQFSRLAGIFADQHNNLYVVDSNNARILKFSESFEFVSKWGEFGVFPGQFNQPIGIAVDPQGIAYVTDPGHNRIQLFTPKQFEDGKAIIVVGGKGESDELWGPSQLLSNFAYFTLIYQGFTKQNIYYLNAKNSDLDGNGELDDVDDFPTLENVKKAITKWAKADNPQGHLTLYLIDHGIEGAFLLSNSEDLEEDNLNDWLNEFQATGNGTVKLIYEACYSGSFIAPLAKQPKRLIVTSADKEETAKIHSTGISFSYFFWNSILYGANIGEAFTLAYDHVLASKSNQTPQLETTGDHKGNPETDHQPAQNYWIGNLNPPTDHQLPEIISVSPEKIDTDALQVDMEVNVKISDSPVAKVWAEIRPESGVSPYSPSGTLVKLPSFELLPTGERERGEEQRYTSSIPFKEAGTYSLVIYAQDQSRNIARPKTVSVQINHPYRDRAVLVVTSKSKNAVPMADKAYQVLRSLGYQSEDIYYLSNHPSQGVNALLNRENLDFAFTEWGQEKTQDWLIYWVGDERGPFSTKSVLNWIKQAESSSLGNMLIIDDRPSSNELYSALQSLKIPEGRLRIFIGSPFSPDKKTSLSWVLWGNLMNWGGQVSEALLKIKSQNEYLDLDIPPPLLSLDTDEKLFLSHEDMLDTYKEVVNSHKDYYIGSGMVIATVEEPLLGNEPEISQPSYSEGETVKIRVPQLVDEDWSQAVVIMLPDKKLFAAKGLNQFSPFAITDDPYNFPLWPPSAGELVFEGAVGKEILKKGQYKVFLLHSPTEDLPFRNSLLPSQTLIQKSFEVK